PRRSPARALPTRDNSSAGPSPTRRRPREHERRRLAVDRAPGGAPPAGGSRPVARGTGEEKGGSPAAGGRRRSHGLLRDLGARRKEQLSALAPPAGRRPRGDPEGRADLDSAAREDPHSRPGGGGRRRRAHLREVARQPGEGDADRAL